ncbi:MAG: hypothetical protein COV76_05755 [Candidatus Omnitrophica bacterium CG11_big_fil_rev_8_21_14_0_20_64_10]|nr:MAG: hypothetical protein COV76_05755 [Candidatus Omnitrophica bacterium CG11_big_fil_rev_8_21_14_0_20_64_10]
MIPGSGPEGLIATAVVGLVLGLTVYGRNRSAPMSRAWLRLCLSAGIWAAAAAVLSLYRTFGEAIFWARVSQAAFSLIPAYFLQFTFCWGEHPERLHPAVLWNKRIAGVFALFSLTPLIVSDVQVGLSEFSFYPLAGPFYGLFAAWFVAVTLWGFGVLVRSLRTQVGHRVNQLRYVILASAIGLPSLWSMMPLAFGVRIPPAGQGLFLFYGVIAYAILRWRLMDIRIAVRNTLIYAALYSVLVGLFVVVVVMLGQWFFYEPGTLDRRVIGMSLLAFGLVTLLIRPLDHWLRRFTDRHLFQKQFEWQKTLKDASRGMTRVTSVDHLMKLMAHFIGFRVRVVHVGIFHLTRGEFELKVSRGRRKQTEGLKLSRSHPLPAWLENKKEPVSLDEIGVLLQNEKLFPRRTIVRKSLEELAGAMRGLEAEVCIPAFTKERLRGILVLGEKLSGAHYSQEDMDLLSTLANEGAVALENAQLYEQLVHRMREIEDLYRREHRLFVHTSIALAAAVDARDPYTHGHTERCTAYAISIAEEMAHHPDVLAVPRFAELLNIAALLHDIGKIGVADEILRKKGRLTLREMDKMKEHPTIGAIILQPIKGMEEVAMAVKAHHERFDGKGYPDGLRGEEIPLMTRIISVADTFDSMTTDRPYRRRLPESVAIKEIEMCAGTQFDPQGVEAFVRAYRKGNVVHRPVTAAAMLQ